MKETWWSPGAIRYTRKQVWWLIENLYTIRQGYWPSEHRETGYSGSKKSRSGHTAYYEKSIQVAAELLQRIEKCWVDSYLLLLDVGYSDIIQVIANGEHQDIEKIKHRVNRALAYISGKNRKTRSYSDFKCHRKGDKHEHTAGD